MAFPNTIDATVGGAEQPGKFSTFYHGTDRYQVQFLLDVPGVQAFLMVMKSTDGGITWTEQDSGNRPVVSLGLGGVPYSCCQSSVTVLNIVFLDISTFTTMTNFDMGSDTWGGALATTVPPIGNPFSGDNGYAIQQYACSYRAVSNDIVFVAVGNKVTLDDVVHAICAFTVFDVGTPGFSAWTDLGYLDYSDITTWDMIPCGIVTHAASGRTTVLMQQVARAGPGNLVSTTFVTDDTLNVPLDAPGTVDIELWGAGGGGSPDTTEGGGGGGGGFTAATVAVTPGNSYPVTVGVGGGSGADGTATVFEGHTAGPGLLGTTSPGGLGGAGGVGETFNGGAGGDPGAATGGGGGGSATDAADGNDGDVGGASLGGAGGTGEATGGDGGAGDLINPSQGQPGASPGAGGGGHGSGFLDAGGNGGGDGQASFSWTSIRNTHGCRMWQQAINADNSLGTLTEITEGAYPSRPKGCVPVPISFDVAIFGSEIRITFTGATSTSDKDNISVGKGTSADPVAFTFQTFSSGNGGNGVDSSPALAMVSGITYCCYISSPGDINFLYRIDTGSGFGSPTTIGTLTAPDIREFGRLQASALSTALDITFGTPTDGVLTLENPQ